MGLQIYTLKFDNTHFGAGTLSSSEFSFSASRLFSALYLEAIKINKEADFLKQASQKDFVLSDALPYVDGTFFLPKPIGYPNYSEHKQKVSRAMRRKAKASKKLQYIPWTFLDEYLSGQSEIEKISDKQKSMFSVQYVTKKGKDPYEVAVTSLKCLLYVIAPQNKLLDQLMELLQYSGLGGERSSGYGHFTLGSVDLPQQFSNRLQVIGSGKLTMLLSTSLPREDELKLSMEGAKYLLKKESGFAYSESTSNLLRKQDAYKFIAGSTFINSYQGSIVDVRPEKFPHPVWNYSKGLFYQLNR
ncbi:type III-A CRISPR-associated RAMP protein Csm4 [Ligilactobacillus acidipiscis]|uniref:type III-A CRISPR-associated RAMP protein Csm4 n=1 Tax=Ligilactobacillus acidipiscis TaxID=89059 RepID=UPI0023F8FB2D|nr:type III-A CRISPR-associated RAMP protein Csm4 [Ligilactobacillus acidipiscis]WEV56232.1 type III-A CRISPR-associated RAMP protein Csm4 [Ligilactobacillus acidipiscis]